MRELLDDLIGFPELLQLDRGMGPGYPAGLGDAILGYIKRHFIFILRFEVLEQMEKDSFPHRQ